MLQKLNISNKCWSFECHQRFLNKHITVVTKIWIYTTIFNIDNNKKYFLSTKLGKNMIFAGSYDTKDFKVIYYF